MKSWITTLAIATLTLLGASPSAEARHHRGCESSSRIYISGYRPCGTPIYTERYLIGYDRGGYPIWGYRVVAPPRRYCPPPRPYYEGYRDSGVVIQGYFRL